MNNRLILVEGIYYVLVKVLFKYCAILEILSPSRYLLKISATIIAC